MAKFQNRLLKGGTVFLSVAIIMSMSTFALWANADSDTQTTLDISKGSISIGDGTVNGYDSAGDHITIPNQKGYILTGSAIGTADGVTIDGASCNITLNISKDYFRSRAFIEKSSTVEYMDVDSHISPFFENSVAYCVIRNAVLALPEDQSDAILLFYYNGYTIREISKMTNAREATVKSRIHQAVSKLKKALLGGEYNERI